MNKTTISTAIAVCLGITTTNAYAIDAPITNMEFLGSDFTAQGTLSSSAGAFSHIESVDPFFGAPWAAAGVAYFEPGKAPTEDLDLLTDEGNVTNNTAPTMFDDPNINGVFTQALADNGPEGNGGTMYNWTGNADQGAFSYDFSLQPNEVAWGTLFNWSGNGGIPTLVIVDCLTNPSAGCIGRGTPMVTAPFPGQAPIFSSGPQPTVPTVAIDLTGGRFHECSETGGSIIAAAANIAIDNTDDIVSVNWSLNGDFVGSGDTISVFTPLAGNTLSVAVDTVANGVLDDDQLITVRDSTPPDLNIQYIDTKSGVEITSIPRNGRQDVSIHYDVADICDPEPTVSGVASPVHPANNGDTIIIKQQLETSAINVSATAVDASGNEKHGEALLLIVD